MKIQPVEFSLRLRAVATARSVANEECRFRGQTSAPEDARFQN